MSARIGSASPKLLREWGLLRTEVAPQLPSPGGEGPTAWVSGTEEDAVAVTVAFQDALDSGPGGDRRGGGRQVSVFVSGPPGDCPVAFSSTDLRTVPAEAKRRWFWIRDRRWYPTREATERILLRRPGRLVDMIAIRNLDRTGRERAPGDYEAQMRALQPGGLVLWIDQPPRDPTRGFEPLAGAGRVARKVLPDAEPAAAEPPPGADDCLSLAAKEDVDRLVRSHYALAVNLARRFARTIDASEDLEQVALVGLVGAARRYRPDRNAAFSTYATASILGEIKRHFRDKSWMLRVPRSLKENYLAVKEARERLGQELGASPTVDQIAEDLRLTSEDVLAAMEVGDNFSPMSLDTPLSPDGDPVQVPSEDSGFDAALNHLQLRDGLTNLSPIEHLVLGRIFFENQSQRDIARELGTNQMYVSRVMTRAVRQLRQSFREIPG